MYIYIIKIYKTHFPLFIANGEKICVEQLLSHNMSQQVTTVCIYVYTVL